MNVTPLKQISLYRDRYVQISERSSWSTKVEGSRVRAKWGDAAVAGWQALPDVLLKHQGDLQLTPTDMLVAINLLSYWWYPEAMPFPRINTIAKRMAVTPRTVQRSISALTAKGYFRKITDVDDMGNERIVLDPVGLVSRLNEFARSDPSFEYRSRKEMAFERQKSAA